MVLVHPRPVASRTGASAGLTPYQHALTDAAFRARLGRRYAGGHDLLDALWWLEHPGEPGPTGARPPDALLAEARRSLYRPSPPADALRRYTATSERERADRASLLAALEGAEQGSAEPLVPPPETAGASRGRIVRTSVPVLLGLLAILGWSRPPAAPVAAAAAAEPRPVRVEAEVGTPERPIVFAPLQRAHPAVERPLASVAGSTVLGVRAAGLVCLELRTGRTESSACRSVAGFDEDGLEMALPMGGSRVGEVRWSPDGRLHLTLIR